MVIHIQGKDQPAVFQAVKVVLDRVDAPQAKLLFELVERDPVSQIVFIVNENFSSLLICREMIH